MESAKNIAKQQQQSQAIEKSYLPTQTETALILLLDETATFLRQPILPGDLKKWMESFPGESPEMLREAFKEHIRVSPFMPKPAEILFIIHAIRERKFAGTFVRIDKERVKAEQDTPEWKAANLELRQKVARLAGKPEPTE